MGVLSMDVSILPLMSVEIVFHSHTCKHGRCRVVPGRWRAMSGASQTGWLSTTVELGRSQHHVNANGTVGVLSRTRGAQTSGAT